jgi:hypothetical protein
MRTVTKSCCKIGVGPRRFPAHFFRSEQRVFDLDDVDWFPANGEETESPYYPFSYDQR